MAIPTLARSGWAALLSALLPMFAWAQVPGAEDAFADCGLEPPGAVYVPAPGPRAYEGQREGLSEPPWVRREERGGVSAARVGLPQTRVREGALSGKVVYLSPGHGFYRSGPLARWATQRPNTHEVVEDFISAEALNQYLLPMLTNAGASVVPLREPDLNPRMAIVNNGDTRYQEQGDAALFSTSELPGWGPPPVPARTNVEAFQLGGSRRMRAERTATASATWTPDVPVDGYYHVYVGYEAAATRVPDAHYVVRHAGGESHFRVNQRRHGGTWVLLGRFYFKAGAQSATASVVALNDSSAEGTVSLDVVRFGGGSGFIGDSTVGPLPRPRYEEAARYHMQFSGAPASVYAPSGANAIANERNDDVTGRARFAAWHHETGEDAIYVAWHTNASAGAGLTVGTEGYVYGPNGPGTGLNFTGVPGSDVLARALLAELGQDLRTAIDPVWTVRNLRSANFGEINPAHNPETPAVLLEIAYHDSMLDAAHLKEPNFRYVAARAMLQGIIKYFATKDGVSARLPPEPPVAVAARNTASGVKVRWTAVARDTQDLGGHEAASYRVYQSADGLAWDEGTAATDTFLDVALPAGAARYFRVAAVNAGGESFPSDVVGVRTGVAPPVLLLNAFDRLDSTMARAEALTAYDLGAPLRALLEAMNDGTYVRHHGEALARYGVAFDSATNEALAAGLVTLPGYRVVDWFTGRGGVNGKAPTHEEQDALRAYVTAGGHLLFSGAGVASALAGGDAADQAFLADILRASVGSGSSSARVRGQPGDYLEALAEVGLDDGTSGAYLVGPTDVLLPAPAAGASAVLRYEDSGLAAAVASAPGGQVLFLGVPLEGLASSARRSQVVGAFLARGGVLGAAPPVPPEDPAPEDPGPANRWPAASNADPRPPPPPPPPAPVVKERMPEFYALGETGCGCAAGLGTGASTWLLLLLTVQLRVARRHGRRSER
ncbi:N-acetylmuramoyl-L-alanine amidase [Myxococcaceae bacterium GXIMD 01537]